MLAVLKTLSSPFETVPAALVVTLLLSIAALVVIGFAVRRLRARGTLTLANASTSAAAATLVLAGALLASASIGLPTAASASSPLTTHSTSTSTPSTPTGVVSETDDGYLPIPLEGLEGYQLPTE